MLSAVARIVRPSPASNGCSWKVSHAGPRIGIAAFVKLGCPIATVAPSRVSHTWRIPAGVSTSNDAPWPTRSVSRSHAPTHRIPLPDISATDPSALVSRNENGGRPAPSDLDHTVRADPEPSVAQPRHVDRPAAGASSASTIRKSLPLA